MSNLTVVLCEPRNDDPLRRRFAEQLLAGWAERADLRVSVVGPLYDLSANGPGAEHLRSLSGDLAVLGWLHPRAARWVLHALGVKGRAGDLDETDSPAGRTIWCLDLRGQEEAEACFREIDRIARLGNRRDQPSSCGAGVSPAQRDAGETPSQENAGKTPAPQSPVGQTEPFRVEEAASTRWYPVIDRGRCVNCLECLNFCLFGVFGLDATETIIVEQPDACRPGCPACARICPAGAIMFPRHADATIAGEASSTGGGVPIDISQLFGGITPDQRAAAQRDRAECASPPSGAETRPEPADLDGLVDELDGLEL
jgi:NAD-dependent dihydropyrimidine dehydrogenase PreA subunit